MVPRFHGGCVVLETDGGAGGCTTMGLHFMPLNRVYLQTVNMVNFMLCAFCHSKNKGKGKIICGGFLKVLFVFRERGEGREKERERNTM